MFLYNFKAVLRSNKGFVDMGSVIIGFIVMIIVASVIAVTVLAVIPWSQDQKAKADLGSVLVAENTFRGMTVNEETGETRYTGKTGLVDFEHDEKKEPLLSGDVANLEVHAAHSGECFVAVSKSATGTIFYISDKYDEAAEYVEKKSAKKVDYCLDIENMIKK